MADFHGRRHLKFLIHLLIGWNLWWPSWIWKTIVYCSQNNSLLSFSAPDWLRLIWARYSSKHNGQYWAFKHYPFQFTWNDPNFVRWEVQTEVQNTILLTLTWSRDSHWYWLRLPLIEHCFLFSCDVIIDFGWCHLFIYLFVFVWIY